MARFISTFINPTPDPNNATGGLTLDALMKRRDELAQRQTQNAQPQVIASPWQGLAQIGQTISTGIQEGRAASQEAAGRDALTRAMTGFDPAAPDTAKLAEVAKYDPDMAQKLYSEAMRVRQENAQYQRTRADTLADREAGYTHEELINKREADEAAGIRTETRNYETGHEETINERERLEEEARHARDEKAKQDAETAKRAFDTEQKQKETDAAKLGIVTGEEAAKRGGDPSRQYKVSADGTKLEDVTPSAATSDPAFEKEQNLRKEYNTQDVIKKYPTVQNGYERMQTGIEQANSKTMDEKGRSVGDIALIYGFMKLQDPDSVVREGEFATAANAGGVLPNVMNLYNKVLNGDTLTPEVRAGLMQQAKLQYGNYAKQVADTNARYDAISRNAGVDPSRVLIQPKVYEEPKKVDEMSDEELEKLANPGGGG